MLEKMLDTIINSESETTIPESETDLSYLDTMSHFADVDTDFFSNTAVRTF